MNRAILLAPALLLSAAATPPPAAAPSEIVDAAPVTDWVTIAETDLLVMDLGVDASGKARRVIIQLISAPFSQGWVDNVRRLAAARWWDRTSVNRVQDNYVVQWGDATEKKALPKTLSKPSEADYAALRTNQFGQSAQTAMPVKRAL